MSTGDPVIRVEDLHVWFDLPNGNELHAVQGVTFELHEGERMGLVGESGCGKTTTILAMMGLLPASASVAGKVILGGEDILARGEESISPHRWKDISMVFQGAMNAFNPVKTIGEQIAEPMELHGSASGKAARAQVRELLELVGIAGDRADRYPHEFSGGMRQRAAIAMALACSPKVLLADEPTTALDVMVQAQILELLVKLSQTLGKELGLTVILVTHDLPVVAQVCDRAAVMYAGEIVEMGGTSEIYHDPRHPYTRMLFAATPDLLGDDEVISIPGAPPRLDREIVGCPFRPRCDSVFEPCASVHPRRLRAGSGPRGALSSERRVGHGGRFVSTTGTDPQASSAPLLEVEGLVTRYPISRGLYGTLTRQPKLTVQAVDGVSFTVGAGEMVALVGESGCGKTSTAQTVIRMVASDAGSIRFCGAEIAALGARELRPLRREIQIIYQDPYESLDPRFTVRDTIEEPIRVHGLVDSASAREERVHEAMERAGLTPPELFIDRYPHELSGGQRQRVAIAAALVLEPKLLIADEPVSMLDVSVRAGILALLDGLRKDGMGVLMITHDLSTAAHFADRIAVMYLGGSWRKAPRGMWCAIRNIRTRRR